MTSRSPTSLSSPSAAHSRVHRHFLQEAQRVYRSRRECMHQHGAPSGVQAVAELCKKELGTYAGERKGHRQISLIADDIAEPPDPRCAKALDLLPPDLAHLIADESRCLDMSGKSSEVFKQIEQKYAFVGGSEYEYIKYLRRPECEYLWTWDYAENVKAFCGVSAVLKKDGSQRKVLMPCAQNYLFIDPKNVCDSGLLGGGALSTMHVEASKWAIASFDQENSFTRVEAPPWMPAWQAGPPVQAGKVWDLLPAPMKSRCSVSS